MDYTNVGVMLTKKCTAECSMCCFGCSPKCNDRLDLDEVKRFLAPAKSMDQIDLISFTGGEAFMLFDDLSGLIGFCSNELGKTTTVATNGFWGRSYQEANDMVGELKSVGLGSLGVSFDKFHNEYIPVESIRNVLRAGRENEVPVSLTMTILEGDNPGELISQLGDDARSLQISIATCLPTGVAEHNCEKGSFIRDRNIRSGKCYSNSIFLYCDGRVFPCCSPVVAETNLSVGSISNMTVKEAFEKISKNALLFMLHEDGFSNLIDFDSSVNGSSFSGKCVNPCEVCKYLTARGRNLSDYVHVVDRYISNLEETSESN